MCSMSTVAPRQSCAPSRPRSPLTASYVCAVLGASRRSFSLIASSLCRKSCARPSGVRRRGGRGLKNIHLLLPRRVRLVYGVDEEVRFLDQLARGVAREAHVRPVFVAVEEVIAELVGVLAVPEDLGID